MFTAEIKSTWLFLVSGGEALPEKRILLFSDNAMLTRAIERNLQNHWVLIAPGADTPTRPFDMIILALGVYDNEPLIALAQIGEGQSLGQVPILVISDRPFRPNPSLHIYHLDLARISQWLEARVETLLQPARRATSLV